MKGSKSAADYQTELSVFQEEIGYTFNDVHLLEEALIHSSYANESALPFFNERLEFLGDAALELVTTEKLYTEYPDANEGELTRSRSRLVCKESLSEWAKNTKLPALIRLGRSLIKNGPTKSVQADAAEAVFGAVFLDGGYAAAKSVILKFLKIQDESLLSETVDSKTELQQFFQSQGKPVPYYKTIERSGPDHAKKFKVQVEADGRILAEAWGKSIKEAEFAAAKTALKTIN